MKAMEEACKDPDNYKYAMADRPEMLEAMKNFYKNRFGVELETDQIMSMYGSQEGMAHIALVMCDPGDVVLVPNPGYPVFGMGTQLMGAKVETYPLYEKNNFLPDFADIPEKTAKVAKFMIISYPANPVCSVADDSFYEKAIAFAKKYNVILLHDNAYSDIIFGRKEGKSFLSYPGAMEVGIEFYSLSKSYNMTGMRISFALGNKDVIQMFRKVRSQIDYGIFLPIQKVNLPPAPEARGQELLETARLPQGVPFAAVSVRDWPGTGEFPRQLAALCDHLRRTYGMEILFLMMQPGHDRAATQQVRQAMEEPSYLLEASCTPQELMAVLGQARLCVAMRLHTLIFAARMAVPCLGLVYDPKVESYLQELELPSAGHVERFDAREAIACADRLMADYDVVLSRLRDKSQALAQAALRNEELLLQLLEGSAAKKS